jgi:hypothetical protein
MPKTLNEYKSRNNDPTCAGCANRVARYKDQIDRMWCCVYGRSVIEAPRAWDSCNGKNFVPSWDE